ncbi:MAG: hypothetical protein V4620_10775 [Bacteroidota bacterium]
MKDTLIKYDTSTITKIQHLISLNESNSGTSQLITNIVTILIGLIAGIIALYQVKSNIISSARINWIENLRESISSYCSEVTNCATIIANMHNSCKGKTGEDLDKTILEYYSIYYDSANKSYKLGTKVFLYLNSKEKNHKEIEDLIYEISDHLHNRPMAELNRDKLEKDLNEIVKISKTIFKKEWDKSKKIFRI